MGCHSGPQADIPRHHQPNDWHHPAISTCLESDVALDRLYVEAPETHSWTERHRPPQQLFRGLERVRPLASSLPKYHSTTFNSVSVFLFTQGWPTVILPLRAHVQPKSRLDMKYFFSWFWWPNFHSIFYFLFESCSSFSSLPVSPFVVEIIDVTLLDCADLSSQKKGGNHWEIKSWTNLTYPVFTCTQIYCKHRHSGRLNLSWHHDKSFPLNLSFNHDCAVDHGCSRVYSSSVRSFILTCDQWLPSRDNWKE